MAGLDQVKRNSSEAFKRLIARAADGIQDGAELIARRALPMTPIDTGKLRNSQRVTSEAGRPVSVVSYTDPKAPLVHEQPRRYRVGGNKFLERAALEGEGEIAEAVARRLKV